MANVDASSSRLIRVMYAVVAVAVAIAADPSDSCSAKFEVHDDKIIRTEDSKKLGAKFIDSAEQHNRVGCLDLCCRTARCDVFVFEEKVNTRQCDKIMTTINIVYTIDLKKTITKINGYTINSVK